MTEPCPFVSRGGLKLAAALDAFALDVTDFVCADLGCNVGGFTDCLLQRGAQHVFALDTGYGQLAWKLRNDPRVSVHERTNAMHCDPCGLRDAACGMRDRNPHPATRTPQAAQRIDLAVIDLAWTRQQYAIPAALRWRPRHIITLIKPHYEAGDKTDPHGVLAEPDAEVVLHRVLNELPAMGVTVMNHIRSPILGGAGKGRKGNIEYLAWVKAKISDRRFPMAD
ncbi:MAG: SAM-dependent methyltransferase [Phycisphaeraceae bacterium]